MMIEEEDIFEEGDTVEYFPVGAAMQTSVGAIKRIITESEQVGIQTVKAGEDAPRYVIQNLHTGKETAYKKENLIKKREEERHHPKPKNSMTKSPEFQEGDRVIYRPVGGAMQTTVGVIKRIITDPEEVGTRHTVVKASEEEPRYVIENEHTKKETAYKRENILEKAEEEE